MLFGSLTVTMKNILIALLVLAFGLLADISEISPVQAQEYPFPPLSPDESWQPPYEGGEFIEPPVNVETYGQTWSNLQITPPLAVAPGIPSSMVNAYLVNSYGQILTNLYHNGVCYLIVSFNGPGYFYLWEYYPSSSTLYGHWLCYRWYRPYAGVWRIGPFAAQPLDPAGRYIWKMWFLSEYSWSTRSLSFDYTNSYYPPDIPVLTPEPVYPPVINSFSANKSSIDAGGTAILTWTTTNASNVTISPGVGTVAASGSTTVTPASTTTYTLVANGKSGNPVSSTATITVIPRIPPTISVSQATIKSGQSTSLSWDAPGAVQVSINDVGNVGITGTRQVSPDKTTTYTITSTYIDGTSQSISVTVNVEQPPYLLWGLIFLLAVAAIVIALLLTRRPARVHRVQETDTQAGHPIQSEETHTTDTLPVTTPVVEATPAKLAMPDGNELLLAGNARSLGRHDFEEFMPREHVTYISRQHINIWYEDGQYYIEDRSSTNGTKINGTDIKGTGRHQLADGDAIELAGKLSIIFKENKGR
jgi:hypothetical protein